MNRVLPLLLTIFLFAHLAPAQKPAPHTPHYTPSIEPSACPIQIDSSFQTRCGYLVVPENRTKLHSPKIKLPFIIAYSKNPDKRKDPLLYTTGGPGGSSLDWITGAIRHSVILDRDCIAFEQRGTRYALPSLDGPELSDAIVESYRKNLNKDSMVLVGVQRFKKALQSKGIDLTGYNTDETVADIDDLLIALHIDSVNLFGVSYSGGLMLDVLRKDPARIRSLILDSPLPNFVPIDEDEPANFIEALKIVFGRAAKDSTNHELYENLYPKFEQYFSSIKDKIFSIRYADKRTTDTLDIQYTRNDLLDIIEGQMFNVRGIKDIPYMVNEIINGRHDPYIRHRLDNFFDPPDGPNGMRLSVYCADQTAYHDERILDQLHDLYPYLRGYHINDVYRKLCDCWQVPPIARESKEPFYSNRPALLGDGRLDPACRPLYIDRIHHYLPNSQRLVFPNRSHVVFFNDEMDAPMRAFLNDPYKKVLPPSDAVPVE
ncbi:MAG TPA: alpha/beta fold hydrolase [Puia sp.]|jgi:pimeloyl-ACP methyl ester carboxylesterase|nr:alpha/beta fold hydrolase [Puia sp.]